MPVGLFSVTAAGDAAGVTSVAPPTPPLPPPQLESSSVSIKVKLRIAAEIPQIVLIEDHPLVIFRLDEAVLGTFTMEILQ